MRLLQPPPRLKFLPKGRPSSRFRPWFFDIDGSRAVGGSMIRHAPEALCPVDPLPVPVIELSFRAVLVFPVGKPHLLASHPAAAPLSAVDLPPVAASTDVKPHPAPRAQAKQLDPCHFAGHTPQDFIARQALVRAGARATTAAALLENPRIGVIHLDRRGQILEINDRARSLLRRDKGLSDRDGVLRTRQPADQRRLERLVAGPLPTAGAVPVSGSMLPGF